MKVVLEFDPCDCPPRIRMIPGVGPVREVSGKVAPTPQYKSKRPIFGEVLAMVSLTDSQQVTLNVTFVDARGNPAKVDGVPVWLTDNSELLALAPGTDGMSCVVSAVGPLGSGVVSLKADADLGVGVAPIVGVLPFEVTAGSAVTVQIVAGAVTEQPVTPPAPAPAAEPAHAPHRSKREKASEE